MIDKDLKPWLIEVNTNPCIEESSGLLKQLVPRMLDDAFKLTLDVIYPPIQNLKLFKKSDDEQFGADYLQQETQQLNNGESPRFHVDGYADDLNMWGDSFY